MLDIRIGEKVMIQCPGGALIDIMLTEVREHRRTAKLSFNAPKEYRVDREEIYLGKKAAGDRR